jgi:hypothetical protein
LPRRATARIYAYEAGAPIINAADSDWTDPKVVEALTLLGLQVIQLLSTEELAACKKREP